VYLFINSHACNVLVVQVSATKGNKRRLTFRQRIGLVESSALKSLAATIEARRSCLETEFQNKDPQSKGENRALKNFGAHADEPGPTCFQAQ